MDEGLNMFLKHIIILTIQGRFCRKKISIVQAHGKISCLATLNLKKSNYMAYIYGARKNADLSRIYLSEKYGLPAYHEGCLQEKTAMGFEHLLSHLGDSSLMSR